MEGGLRLREGLTCDAAAPGRGVVRHRRCHRRTRGGGTGARRYNRAPDGPRTAARRVHRGFPLRHAPFRRYYYGSIGTALGFTMLATAGAWLMATLTPSALMVALVQTASTAPTLAFGLIAGSLADLVDRRRIIIGTQFAMGAAGLLLGFLTLYGLMNPVLLLLLIVVVGAAFTFYMPASGAAINEMVGARGPAARRRARRRRLQRLARGRAGAGRRHRGRLGERLVAVLRHRLLHPDGLRRPVGAPSRTAAGRRSPRPCCPAS